MTGGGMCCSNGAAECAGGTQLALRKSYAVGECACRAGLTLSCAGRWRDRSQVAQLAHSLAFPACCRTVLARWTRIALSTAFGGSVVAWRARVAHTAACACRKLTNRARLT